MYIISQGNDTSGTFAYQALRCLWCQLVGKSLVVRHQVDGFSTVVPTCSRIMIWLLYGYDMVIIWLLYGYYMVNDG